MNTKKTFTVAAAALSGLLAGSAARAAVITTGTTSTGSHLTSVAGDRAIMLDDDKHDCKGKNSCSGKGGCKTGDQGCKGKNTCKGKGGCSTKTM